MIEIPLFALLIVYIVFLMIFTIFYVINAYHIIGTGTFTLVSFLVMFIIFILVVITSFSTWALLSPVDWSKPLISFGGGSAQQDVLGF